VKLRRSTSLAALAALALTGVLVSPGSPAAGSTAQARSARASLGTLSVSPTRFVSGQSLTWTGTLPVQGVRTITMQRFLNRPGDSWINVQGFKAETNADGSFSFHYPAPDMIDIGFRVKSGKYATTKLNLYPKQQDVVVKATDPVVAGQPFTLVADTTTTGAPVIQGRTLTLQRREDPTTWTDLGTTTVGGMGKGTFSVTEPSAGTEVYRVIEEDWTTDGNQIGWYPSFPTYVDVLAAPSARTSTPNLSDRSVASTTSSRLATTKVARSGARRTAALRWKWGYPMFDFDWTSGESLTSPPWRGSRPQGQWTEYLGGTGRVAKKSGQLGVWSGRTDRYGSGDRGTTATTLQGNAQSYGRWEMKLRTVTKTSGPRYLVRAELVPELAADYDCGAHNITIAEIRGGQSNAVIGAARGTTQWTRSVSLGNLDNSTPMVAVELMKDHVTWFVNSSPVGTLQKRRIAGDVPMTLRLSLIGADDREMANTTLLSDWQRGFPINRSPGVLSGASLKKSAFTPTCG
jgi:hypothetical protein